MKKIKIKIERSADCFWAYAENVEGISGAGETASEAKAEALESVQIQIELGNIPNEKYEFEYKYDTESVLNYYKGIFTNAALERITGINQAQISHYATGVKKPREAQIRKIENAFKLLGKELIEIKL